MSSTAGSQIQELCCGSGFYLCRIICVWLAHKAVMMQRRLFLHNTVATTELKQSGILSAAASTICFGWFFFVLICVCKVSAPRRLLTALAATWCSTSSSPITTPPPQSRLRSAPAESAVSEWAVEWPWTASTLHVGSSGGEGSHHRRGANKYISF